MTLFIDPLGVHHRCHKIPRVAVEAYLPRVAVEADYCSAGHAVSRREPRCHECNVSPVMNVIIRYSYKRHI